MTRKEYCPDCEIAVVGLFQNIRNKNPSNQWIRRAYYCKKCKRILTDNEIVYKRTIYMKKEVDKK